MPAIRPDLVKVVNKPADLSHLVPDGLLCAYDFIIRGNGVIKDISQKTLNGGNPGSIHGATTQTSDGIAFGYTTMPGDGGTIAVAKDGYISLQNPILGAKTICMSIKAPVAADITPLFSNQMSILSGLTIAGYGAWLSSGEFVGPCINGDPYDGGSIQMSVIGNESWLNIVFSGPTALNFAVPVIGLMSGGEGPDLFGAIEIRDLRVYSREFSLSDCRAYSNELNSINMLYDFSDGKMPDGTIVLQGGFSVLNNGQHNKKAFNYLSSTGQTSNLIALPSQRENYGYHSILIKKSNDAFVQWIPISNKAVHPDASDMNCIKVTYQPGTGLVGIFNIRNGESHGGYENPIAITDDEWHLFELDCNIYGDIMLTVDSNLVAAFMEYNGVNPRSNELTPNYAVLHTDKPGVCFVDITSKDTSNKTYPQLYDVVFQLSAPAIKYNYVDLQVDFLPLNSPQTYENVVYERSTDGINFIVIAKTQSLSYRDTTVLPETNYYYRAYVTTSNQNSESFDLNITTPEQQFPMILKLVTTTPNTNVQWTNSSQSGFNYNYTVDFGDGTQSGTYGWYGNYNHVYATPGTYYFTLSGTCTHFGPSNTAFRNALREVVSWGNIRAKVLNFTNSQLAVVPVDTYNGFSTLTQLPGFGNTKLVSVPAGIFDNAVNITAAYGVFQGCQLLTTVPADLLKNSVNVTQISSMFANCPSLTAVPVRMIDNCPNIYNFYGVFFNCVNLTGLAPEWWNIYTAPNVIGYDCFLPDVNLTNYLDIPDPWGGVQIPLAPPSNLAATAVDATKINLTWTNNDLYDFIDIQRSVDGINFQPTGGVFGEATSAQDAYCDPETRYWYTLQAQKGPKQSINSNIADATTPAPLPPAFRMTVDMSLPGTANNRFYLPISGFPQTGYDCSVDWGDGSEPTVVIGVPEPTFHDYPDNGIYQISITGTVPQMKFQGFNDCAKVISLDEWGTNQWLNADQMFAGCSNLEAAYTDVPDFSLCISFAGMFDSCSLWNGSTTGWVTSLVTDFSRMFMLCPIFNQPIEFDTSAATTMEYMFYGASAFNQTLEHLITSSVTTFNGMFTDASSFNQDPSWIKIIVATNAASMLNGTNLSIGNWSNALGAWAYQSPSVNTNVVMGAAGKRYNVYAKPYRTILIDTYLWTIDDGGSVVQQSLGGNVVSSSQIDISWINEGAPLLTRVQMSTDGVNYSDQGSAGPFGTGVSITGLTADTAYWFRTRYEDLPEVGDWSVPIGPYQTLP